MVAFVGLACCLQTSVFCLQTLVDVYVTMNSLLVTFRRSKFLKFGLPFIIVVVGGSFALTEFTDIRVKRKDERVREVTKEETLSLHKRRGKAITIEDALKEVQTNVNIDDWENKRGPRPWEDLRPKDSNS